MKQVLFLALGLLTACATITKDSDQKISVATTPAGATCELRNDSGSWKIAQTPGDAVVKRNFSPLVITCHEGERHATTTLEPRTRGRAYGNILLGGAPAIIDANTGAGYEYKPASVTLDLVR